MKVKELIEQLMEVDLELEVFAHKSVVTEVEVVRGPKTLKIQSPLFIELKTRFEPRARAD